MFTKSLWNTYSTETNFPTLHEDITADVAIIGGGITGIVSAYLLAKEGKRVLLLESLKIGGGTTSHSTGNLYHTVSRQLQEILSKHNNETLQLIVEARKAALELIEQLVTTYNLDCDFEKVPWHEYTTEDELTEKIENEFKIGMQAGLKMDYAKAGEFPLPIKQGIKILSQAQFNPMLFVKELAKAINSENCKIYENTRVLSIEEESDFVEIKVAGATVKAGHVIQATHTPKGVLLLHTLLGPYREYGVAGKYEGGGFPKGIFWGYHENEEKYSFRSYQRGNDNLLIVIGQPHKVGQVADNRKNIMNLERFLRMHFGVTEITHRWGGQHYRPADYLPYIGHKEKDSRIFVATGFGVDGLVWGPLSGLIIKDLILNKENPWFHTFDSNRHAPLKAAKNFIKENINVAGQYLKNIPGIVEEDLFSDVKAGEGCILEKDGQKIAAFRNENGDLSVLSAICPHLACVVQWNDAERTWDCPCHGSRFSTDGTLLEGPAIHPLKSVM